MPIFKANVDVFTFLYPFIMLQSAAVVLLQFCFTNANSLLVLCVRRGLSKNEFEVGHLWGGTVVGGCVRPWLCVVYLGVLLDFVWVFIFLYHRHHAISF